MVTFLKGFNKIFILVMIINKGCSILKMRIVSAFLDIRHYNGMNATSKQLKQVLTDFSLFTIQSCSFSVTVFIGDSILYSYKYKMTLLSVDTINV